MPAAAGVEARPACWDLVGVATKLAKLDPAGACAEFESLSAYPSLVRWLELAQSEWQREAAGPGGATASGGEGGAKPCSVLELMQTLVGAPGRGDEAALAGLLEPDR